VGWVSTSLITTNSTSQEIFLRLSRLRSTSPTTNEVVVGGRFPIEVARIVCLVVAIIPLHVEATPVGHLQVSRPEMLCIKVAITPEEDLEARCQEHRM